MKVRLSFVVACGLALLFSPAAHALFAPPDLVPTERMLKNTDAYLQANPRDAQAHYTKARILYLSFRNGSLTVQGWDAGASGQLPRVAPNWMLWGEFVDQARTKRARDLATADGFQMGTEEWNKAFQKHDTAMKKDNWRPPELTPAEAIGVAGRALASFEEAIRLEPENGVFLLGKASLLEQVKDYIDELTAAGKTDGVELPAAFSQLNDEKLMALYLRAHQVSIGKDLKLQNQPLPGISSVASYQSGSAVIRLAEKSPGAAGKVEGLDVSRVKAGLKKLEAIPMGPITPILLSLEPDASLRSMVREGHEVRFDVDGDGRRETLSSWPAASAGILVWDRYGTGEIRSGVQWFGSFGFRMIWRDGYAALDAFDDSRDGWLSGAELRDLKLWFDADGDAISDPGEVRGLESCGVDGIAVKATTRIGDSPANLRGVRLRGGRLAPSFDWIVEIESGVGAASR